MIHELLQAGLPLKSILFNRITPPLHTIKETATSDNSRVPDSKGISKLSDELPVFLNRYRDRVRSETIVMNKFMHLLPSHLRSYRIPLLIKDITSLKDLADLHPYLSECMDFCLK